MRARGQADVAMVGAGVFYGGVFRDHLAVVLEWTPVRSIPFVVSFTIAFVLFYGWKRSILRRLLQPGALVRSCR